MNKLLTIVSMAVVAGALLWSGDALATTGNENPFEHAVNRVTEAFQYSRQIIFIIGGFGLVALAFFAIFGKIKWTWFAALCVGLAIVGIAGYVIKYVTETGTPSTAVRSGSSNVSNTFTATSGLGTGGGGK